MRDLLYTFLLSLALGGVRTTLALQNGDAGAPRPLLRRALGAPGAVWTTHATRHARIHVPRGSESERRIGALAASVERARLANLRWLGERAFAPTLDVLFVGRREEMRPLVGSTPGGWAEPAEGTVILVASAETAPAVRHELMHVLSWRLWGTPGGRWLSEGVATAAVGECHGHDLHAVAARLAEDGRLPTVDALRRDFVVAGDVGLAHYVAAGSLVRHVVDTHGRDGLRALWRTGLAGVRESLGVDQATLEAGWRARVARTKAAPAGVYDEVRRRGCESGSDRAGSTVTTRIGSDVTTRMGSNGSNGSTG
jgi:hypothetical protein